MPSVGQQLARLRRQGEKEKNRAKVESLRGAVARARGHRDAALGEVRDYCRKLRHASSASNMSCAERAADAAKHWAPELDRSLQALEAERADQKALHDIETRNRTKDRAKSRASRKERQGESDDEVRRNIPEDLIPIFEKVKRSVKATPRMSRTEVFLHMMEEDPELVVDHYNAIEDETERMIAQHEADLRRGRRNPGRSSVLTELGKLTAITWRGGSKRWPISKAPTLAYCERGRLHIVYALEPSGPATAAERREYARTHWGQGGHGRSSVGDVLEGPARELGPGVSITYTTRKGSNELVDWVHEWGEGARGKWTAPIVIEHVCRERKCGARGTIALKNGSYRVTDRGIVG